MHINIRLHYNINIYLSEMSTMEKLFLQSHRLYQTAENSHDTHLTRI